MSNVEAHEFGEKMLVLAAQYRQMGEELSNNAYKQRWSNQISADQYDIIHRQVEEIFIQAIAINREIGKLTEGLIDTDLEDIENTTKKLAEAAKKIEHIRDIVAVSIKVIALIGATATAVAAPNPASILVALKAAKGVADDIIKMANEADSIFPTSLSTSD